MDSPKLHRNVVAFGLVGLLKLFSCIRALPMSVLIGLLRSAFGASVAFDASAELALLGGVPASPAPRKI